MKVGILIPDRRDRPEFLNHAKYLLEQQTQQPDFIHLVNHEPASPKYVDLVPRIRRGLQNMFENLHCDIAFIWENDDWYAKNFIEIMMHRWNNCRQPVLFGINKTCYYHLGINRYRNIGHQGRASLFTTMISRNANLSWPQDKDPFLDLHLWKQVPGGIAISTKDNIAIGIKHGLGLCGGKSHRTDTWHDRNSMPDQDWSFLKSHVDDYSLAFYQSMHNKVKPKEETDGA